MRIFLRILLSMCLFGIVTGEELSADLIKDYFLAAEYDRKMETELVNYVDAYIKSYPSVAPARDKLIDLAGRMYDPYVVKEKMIVAMKAELTNDELAELIKIMRMPVIKKMMIMGDKFSVIRNEYFMTQMRLHSQEWSNVVQEVIGPNRR